MSTLKYAIIGAGSGGTSMAAQLKARGHYVSLMDIRKEAIDKMNELEYLIVSGKIQCSAKPDLITTDILKAIDGVDVIMIATTTDAHSSIAKKISSYINEKQIIILTPGHVGGVLNFINALKSSGCKFIPMIAEASDLPYACRTVEIGHTLHTGIKTTIKLGSIPSCNAEKIINLIGNDFPMFVPAKDVLDSCLNGVNALLHPIPSIMNINKIDLNEDFDYYIEGITPSICKIIEKADQEINNLYKVMKVDNMSIIEFLHNVYHMDKYDNLYEAIQHNKAYEGLKPPKSIQHRFFQEDMLCTLVPIVSMGKMFGVDMPVLESIIKIENAITGQDFMKEGRTVESLGLSGKTVDEIYDMIK